MNYGCPCLPPPAVVGAVRIFIATPSMAAAQQLTDYTAAAKAALGALPTFNTLIFERFLDEVGDMHFVVHSPFGSRINRAWGLALRKRFCRKFNFELQAAATEPRSFQALLHLPVPAHAL